MSKRLVVAVDFDGTIVEEDFPEIGEIKWKTVELMERLMEEGHIVMIWTARSKQFAEEAKEFLNENGIPYTYFNENPEDEYFKRGIQGRKIFADVYLDDRAVHVDDIEKVFKMI